MTDSLSKKIPRTHFTTRLFSKKDRFNQYRESIGVVFDTSKPIVSQSEFQADITAYHLGQMVLVRCQTRRQKFVRTKSMISRDNIDHYLIQVFPKGHTRGNNGSIGGGSNLILIDTTQPWEAINSDFDNITLVIPRSALADKLVHEDEHHGRLLDLSRPLESAFGQLMMSIERNGPDMSIDQALSLTDAATDLLATTLNQGYDKKSHSSAQSAAKNVLKSKTLQCIDTHLSNTSLCPKTLQNILDVNKGELDSLFSNLPETIRDRRLEVAHKILSNPIRSSLIDLEELVAFIGYPSVKEFSEHFVQVFGVSPAKYRDEIISESFSELTHESVSSRLWETWLRKL